MEFESTVSNDDSDVDMISTVQTVTILLPEYENATLHGFLSGIKYLSTKYRKFRKVRGYLF